MMLIAGLIAGMLIPIGIILMGKKVYRYYCKIGDYVYFFQNDVKVIGRIQEFYEDKAIIFGLHGKKYAVYKKELYEI